jgi:hypothetical protein
MIDPDHPWFDRELRDDASRDRVIGAAIMIAIIVSAAAFWDSDDDLLTVGTGAARKTMVDLDSTQSLTGKSLPASSIASGQLAAARGGTALDTSATGNLPLCLIEIPPSRRRLRRLRQRHAERT